MASNSPAGEFTSLTSIPKGNEPALTQSHHLQHSSQSPYIQQLTSSNQSRSISTGHDNLQASYQPLIEAEFIIPDLELDTSEPEVEESNISLPFVATSSSERDNMWTTALVSTTEMVPLSAQQQNSVTQDGAHTQISRLSDGPILTRVPHASGGSRRKHPTRHTENCGTTRPSIQRLMSHMIEQGVECNVQDKHLSTQPPCSKSHPRCRLHQPGYAPQVEDHDHDMLDLIRNLEVDPAARDDKFDELLMSENNFTVNRPHYPVGSTRIGGVRYKTSDEAGRSCRCVKRNVPRMRRRPKRASPSLPTSAMFSSSPPSSSSRLEPMMLM